MRKMQLNLTRAVEIANAILRDNEDKGNTNEDRLTNEEANAIATLARYAQPAAWGNVKRGDEK